MSQLMPLKLVREHFKHCPTCGSDQLSLQGELAIKCPVCGYELYFNPVSSAASLIEDEEGKLLVIKRAREPAKGKYGLPGGFVDLNESAETTASREAKEEVNLDIESLSFLGSFPNEYAFRGMIVPVLDLYFLAKVSDFSSLRKCDHEVDGVEFVDAAKVPESMWAFPALKAAIRKYLELKQKS